jgi:chromosome segregation ATPase
MAEGNPISDNLKKALEDLRGAGEKATGDVRSRIDSAVARLNEASSEVTSRAQDGVSKATGQASGLTDQLNNWRETLEKATEDLRSELGKLAARSQTSLDSIESMREELKNRAKSLGGK